MDEISYLEKAHSFREMIFLEYSFAFPYISRNQQEHKEIVFHMRERDMMDSWRQVVEISRFEGDDIYFFSFIDECIGQIHRDSFGASSFKGVYEKIIAIFHDGSVRDKLYDISLCFSADRNALLRVHTTIISMTHDAVSHIPIISAAQERFIYGPKSDPSDRISRECRRHRSPLRRILIIIIPRHS